MHEVDFYTIFLPRLNKAGISYMVTGSMACIMYGKPRMTHDIDVVIALDVKNAEMFMGLFPEEEYYCPPKEVMKTELLRENRGHFNIIHHPTGLKADVYPAGQDKLMAWGLANRKKYSVEKETVWVAPPEYVIVQKLLFYREGHSGKHLSDIQGVLDISGEWMDKMRLKELIAKYGLDEVWKLINSDGI